MTGVIAGMTLSLDGYVADRQGSVDRLYSDFDALQGSAWLEEIVAGTGSVLMGMRTFEMAGDPDTYADTYEFQVPIVVLTHHPPAIAPKQNERLTFTFITDGVDSAVAVATEAAGDKAVTVVGDADAGSFSD
jgi:dihydrofolate reductase